MRPFLQHGAGADIFTANMYLAEDRVRPVSPSPHNLPIRPLTHLLDPLLGTRLETRRPMDPPLRQIRLRSDRCARPSARTHLPAPSLAQRIILCRHPLDRQVPLHLSLLAYIWA